MPSTFYQTHDPEAEYLRQGTVLRWLQAKGFSHSAVIKWIRTDTIKPIKTNGCRAWYSRDQIKRDILVKLE